MMSQSLLSPPEKNEKLFKDIASQYLSVGYNFVCLLTGHTKDSVFSLTKQAFARYCRTMTLDRLRLAENADALSGFLKMIVMMGRDLPPAVLGSNVLMAGANNKKNVLGFVKEALADLSYDDRTILLLRDQLHLRYELISKIMGLTQKEAKVAVVRARLQLRDRIDSIIQTESS